jgi:hypothetical protein
LGGQIKSVFLGEIWLDGVLYRTVCQRRVSVRRWRGIGRSEAQKQYRTAFSHRAVHASSISNT